MTYVYAGPPAATSIITSGTGAGYTLNWPPPQGKALQGPPPEHISDGVMLALYPDAATAKALAQPGGTPAPEIHLTLAYLGTVAEVDADRLTAAAQRIAVAAGPIGGQVAGHARFTGGDRDVIVALFDSPALEQLRRITCETLDYAGIELPRKHGYTPHLTLGYLEASDTAALRRLDARPVTFTALSVVHGTDRSDLPLAAGPGFQPGLDLKGNVELGDFVTVDGRLGRVDLLVAGGQLPAAIGLDGQAVTGTKDHPAARIVEYAPAGDGTFTQTGQRIGCPVERLARIAPLRTRQAKSLAEAIGWTQVAYLHTDVPIPPKDLLMAVYGRGVKSWPGPGTTTLTAEQWGLGRVDAFTATWHGLRPAGYHGDDDLLPT